jgi:hypothetical protein
MNHLNFGIMKDELQSQDPALEIEIIDIEVFTQEGRIPPHGKHYNVKIGPHYFVFHRQWVTGKEILEKAGYTSLECHWLFQLIRGYELERVGLDQQVDLAKPGIEHFLVTETEVFYYTVDDEPETTEQRELTPGQILLEAGIKSVSDYYLVKVNADGSQESYKDRMDKPIKMVCPAVKFVSVFKGETPVS